MGGNHSDENQDMWLLIFHLLEAKLFYPKSFLAANVQNWIFFKQKNWVKIPKNMAIDLARKVQETLEASQLEEETMGKVYILFLGLKAVYIASF